MTPLALRLTRRTNAVSLRHGEVAREMWRPLFGDAPADEVPITHVTNGVHLPSFLSPPLRALLDRHLGDGWLGRAADPATWEAVDQIPDAELWAARNEARRLLVDYVRVKSVQDRLLRGEDPETVRAVAETFAEDTLTLGFARRIATYKRLFLLTYDPERVRRIVADGPPLQMIVAGKAHPLDLNAKQMLVDVFALSQSIGITSRVAFLENYDLSVAGPIVGGCDVWVNVPRPPLEASGTSGMKSAANGGLNLSVLDGWWVEGYDGRNGWEIDGAAPEGEDETAQDARHAHALYDLLEQQVIPLFHDRDEDGIPRGWLAMVRASLKTNGPRFSAARMVTEYAERIWPPGARSAAPVSDFKSDTSASSDRQRDASRHAAARARPAAPESPRRPRARRRTSRSGRARRRARTATRRRSCSRLRASAPTSAATRSRPLLEVERQRHHEGEHARPARSPRGAPRGIPPREAPRGRRRR